MDEAWSWIRIGLIIMAVGAPIAYFAGRERTSDAEAAVAARVHAFANALADGEGDGACEMLGEPARSNVVEDLGLTIQVGEPRTCPDTVEAAAERLTASQQATLRDLDVLDVDYQEQWTPAMHDDPGRYLNARAIAILANGEVQLATESSRTSRPENWTITSAEAILHLVLPGVSN